MQSQIFKYYDKNLLAIFLIMGLLRGSYSGVFGLQYFLVFEVLYDGNGKQPLPSNSDSQMFLLQNTFVCRKVLIDHYTYSLHGAESFLRSQLVCS
jgi:hypothetical protein